MNIGNFNFKEDRKASLSRAISEGHSEEAANSRTRGRTLAIALRTISEAMLNPSSSISIQDHNPVHAAKLELTRYIDHVLHDLGLVGFKIDIGKCTLTYTLDYVYDNSKG